MKAKRSGRRQGSLKDYCPISLIDEDGVLQFSDLSEGFVLGIRGIDALTYEQSEFDSLHERWRSFLHLKSDEEIQIVFRKTGVFQSQLKDRQTLVSQSKEGITRRLLNAQMNETLDAIEALEAIETSIHLCFRAQASSSKRGERDESLKNRVASKREELELKLRAMHLGVQRMHSSEIKVLMARAAGGIKYLSCNGVEEWPEISIGSGQISIEGEHFRALSLKKLPESFSELGMIHALTLLPIPLEMCVRFRGKHLEPVKKKIEKRRQVLFGLSSHKSSGDPLAEAQFKEADEVLRRLNEQNDSLCEMTLTLGVRSSDEMFLRRAMGEILSSASRMQQVEFEESPLAVFDYFLETLPCFRGETYHKHSVLSSNGIHFLPFFQPFKGDERPVLSFQTQVGSLYSIDPTAERLANYNWLVSGQSGAGKSFFVNSLLLQSQVLQPRIFIVDIGGSYNKLTEFLGGKLVHVDTEDGFAMGPFFMPYSTNEKEERLRRAHIQLIFHEMLRDEGRLPSVEERAIIQDALEPLLSTAELPDHPISDLKCRLESATDPKAKRLALLLRTWCHNEFFGSFVDHPHPLKIEEDIVTFDLKGLKEFPDLSRVLELVITSALWAALRNRNRFSWVVLDEVAFSLLKTQPGFVQELISTCRKMFAGTVIVVQGLETLTSNVAGAAILSNTNFKAILSQRGDARGYELPLGLRSTEAQIIRSLSRKKGEFSEIFLMDDERRSVLRYTPDPLTYLLSTTDPQEVMALEKALSEFEGPYPDRILQILEKGCE